jgi:TPR repeat protein
MYYKGELGARDKALAQRYYEEACNGGETYGCGNLGSMIYQGEAGPKSTDSQLR